MKTKIICILDRSGSMESILNQSIESFNFFLNEQKEVKGKAKMNIILFDTEFDRIINNKSLKNIEPLTRKTYFTRGSTSLYDCVIDTINKELDFLAEDPKNQPDKTLCVILTDGDDNSSINDSEKAKMYINEMENDFKWNFIFLAANQDAVLAGESIGISRGRSMNFSATEDGVNDAYVSISKATTYYRTTNEENYDNIFEDSKK